MRDSKPRALQLHRANVRLHLARALGLLGRRFQRWLAASVVVGTCRRVSHESEVDIQGCPITDLSSPGVLRQAFRMVSAALPALVFFGNCGRTAPVILALRGHRQIPY